MNKRKLILALTALLAVALVAFWGIQGGLSDELPERPSLGEYPAGLEAEIEKEERSLSLPWGDEQKSLLNLAKLYHANEFLSEAKQCYELILKLNRDAPVEVYYYLANISKYTGDAEAAKRYLKETAMRDPEYMPALLELAELNYKTGLSQEAIDVYRRVLELDTSNPYALLGIARDSMRNAKNEEALILLMQLARHNPDFGSGIAMLTQVLDRLGERERAAAIRKENPNRKSVAPDNPWMEQLMQSSYDTQRLSFDFENYLKAGQIEKAMASLDRIETLVPDSWNPHLLRGHAYYQMKQYAAAIPQFRQSLKLGGDAATLYYYLVVSLKESGDLERAEDEARMGLEVVPDTTELYIELANILLKKRKFKEPMSLLEKAIELDGLSIAANRTLAELYWKSGRRKKAVDRLKVLQLILPEDISSRAMIGEYYLSEGEIDIAMEALSQAFSIDSENEQIGKLLSLAQMRSANEAARNGAFDEAIQGYELAVESNPRNEEAYFNKVKLCLHLEYYDKAEDAVRSLLEMKPNEATLYVTLGDIQSSAGKTYEANQSWDRALEISAGSKQIEAAIKQRRDRDSSSILNNTKK